MPNAIRPLDLESLPHVWRAPELALGEERVVTTGHPPLDAQLPGGGWPVGALVEVLQDAPGRHVWQLLLPALRALAGEQTGPVVLVQPPFEPFAPALQARGLSLERLMRVQAVQMPVRWWATEQALRCMGVAAVLAWLPQARAADLRRLQLAAAQHDKLLFVFRPLQARQESSPARVRVEIEDAANLEVRILKRRGPPLGRSIALPAHPPRLARLLASRKGQAVGPPPTVTPAPKERSHVLDRTVAPA